MWYIDHIYFTFSSIHAVIVTIFFFVIAVFLFKIQNKASSSRYLAYSFFLSSGVFLLRTLHSAFYWQESAYLTLGIEVLFLPLGLYFLLFLLNYPQELPQRWNVFFSLIVWSAVCAIGYLYYTSLSHTQAIFSFTEQTWHLRKSKIYQIISPLTVSLFCLLPVFSLIKFFSVSRQHKKVFWGFFLIFLISCALFLLRDIPYTRLLWIREYYPVFVSLGILLCASAFLYLYIHFSPEKSSYVDKVTGVFLLFIFLLVLAISYWELEWRDSMFDTLSAQEQRLVLSPEEDTMHVEYLLESLIYQEKLRYAVGREDQKLQLDYTQIKLEHLFAYNFALLRSIPAVSDRDVFIKEAKIRLENTGVYFKAYRKEILKYLHSLPKTEKNIFSKLQEHMHSLQQELDILREQIALYQGAKNRKQLTQILKEPIPHVAFFQKAMLEKIQLQEQQNLSSLGELLVYITPIRTGLGQRKYRGSTRGETHFVSYLKPDTNIGKVYEIAYSYEYYRNYIHQAAKKYIFLLFLVTFLVLYGIRFFVRFTLIAPLEKIAFGLTHVEKGDYQYRVDFQAKNELGFLAEIFNRMTANLITYDAMSQREKQVLEKRFSDTTQIVSRQAQKLSGLEKQSAQSYNVILQYYQRSQKPSNWNSPYILLQTEENLQGDAKGILTGKIQEKVLDRYYFLVIYKPFANKIDLLLRQLQITLSVQSQIRLLEKLGFASLPDALQSIYQGLQKSLEPYRELGAPRFLLLAIDLHNGALFYINQNMPNSLFCKYKEVSLLEKEKVLSDSFWNSNESPYINSHILHFEESLYVCNQWGTTPLDPYHVIHFIRASQGNVRQIYTSFQSSQQEVSFYQLTYQKPGNNISEQKNSLSSLLSGEKYQDAYLLVQSLLKDYKQYPDFLYIASYCLKKMGEYSHAIQYSKKLLQIQASSDKNLLNLAEIFILSANYTEAEVILREILQRDPQHQAALVLKSRINL
ncbi:MAG: tetratricopeptide repeat protein [Spirochaetota bacterium]